MLTRSLGLCAILALFVATGCSDGDGDDSSSADASLSDGGVVVIDGGIVPTADAANPPSPTADGSTPPSPSGYGKICSSNDDCAADELCNKLASDSYPRTGPPPPLGMCLTKCSNTTATCSSSDSHFYPCIGVITWDQGSIQVCAVACYTNFGGTEVSYACPVDTYCSRSFVAGPGPMKVCTPYE